MTMRRALEQSKNLVTARLLDGGIDSDAEGKPRRDLRSLRSKAQVYPQCERFYPFVLGAQPVRPIDLAAFYAAIANEGRRPTPHVIEQISLDGRVVYKANEALKQLPGVDPAAVFQLRTILQGVVARGTAARLERAVATSSPARPAPATNSTTPGSSASATTSPSRSGSATTTPP